MSGRGHMVLVLLLSGALGLGWNLIAVLLMGGGIAEALSLAWASAGVVAGLAAGLLTVVSRRRTGGRERLGYVLATYYLGIVVYWLTFLVVERTRMCLALGRWTDFNLSDHVRLIGAFLVFGTAYCGAVLIPLAYVSRCVVWRLHARVSTR